MSGVANDPPDTTGAGTERGGGGETDRRKLQRYRGSPRERARAVHEINDGQTGVYNLRNADCLLLRKSYI